MGQAIQSKDTQARRETTRRARFLDTLYAEMGKHAGMADRMPRKLCPVVTFG